LYFVDLVQLAARICARSNTAQQHVIIARREENTELLIAKEKSGEYTFVYE
jgi:hypothetical protein